MLEALNIPERLGKKEMWLFSGTGEQFGCVTRGGGVGIQLWHLGIEAGLTDFGQEDLTIQSGQ